MKGLRERRQVDTAIDDEGDGLILWKGQAQGSGPL